MKNRVYIWLIVLMIFGFTCKASFCLVEVKNETGNFAVLDSLKIIGTAFKLELNDTILRNETETVTIKAKDTFFNISSNTFSLYYHYRDITLNKTVMKDVFLKPVTGSNRFKVTLKN